MGVPTLLNACGANSEFQQLKGKMIVYIFLIINRSLRDRAWIVVEVVNKGDEDQMGITV